MFLRVIFDQAIGERNVIPTPGLLIVFVYMLPELFHDLARNRLPGVRKQNNELIAAQSREKICRSEKAFHLFSEGNQRPVTFGMSEIVIDWLELVQIDECQ